MIRWLLLFLLVLTLTLIVVLFCLVLGLILIEPLTYLLAMVEGAIVATVAAASLSRWAAGDGSHVRQRNVLTNTGGVAVVLYVALLSAWLANLQRAPLAYFGLGAAVFLTLAATLSAQRYRQAEPPLPGRLTAGRLLLLGVALLPAILGLGALVGGLGA